jgi:hypothetical protein
VGEALEENIGAVRTAMLRSPREEHDRLKREHVELARRIVSDSTYDANRKALTSG